VSNLGRRIQKSWEPWLHANECVSRSSLEKSMKYQNDAIKIFSAREIRLGTPQSCVVIPLGGEKSQDRKLPHIVK
jgi:hypothetical protein